MLRRRFLQFAAAAAARAASSPVRISGIATHKCTVGRRDYLFVELKTDAGITGLGEATIGGRIDIVEQAVRWFEPYLRGQDPAGIDDHWNRFYYDLSRAREGMVLMTALSAIDIALWDIEGKRLGQPVWRLCGANGQKPLRVYYSHWSHDLEPRTPEALGELVAKTKADGWNAVKWILYKGGTEAERLRRAVREVEAVRKAGGDGFEFGLEMYETFSVRSAIELARAVAPYRPMFIEEPVWRESPQALGEIAAQSPVAVATGEGLLHRYDFRQLLDAKGARIVQPDVIHCGGITEIRRIASLAETYLAELSPHMWYGPVAHTASIHAVASCRNFLIQEWDGVSDRMFTEWTRGTYPVPANGVVRLPTKPGLGIEMDFALLAKRHRYTGQSLRPPGGR